jgi:cytochrome c-type biogenesis protein CcmH
MKHANALAFHITMRFVALVMAFAIVLGWAFSPVIAQTPDPNDKVYDVAKQLNCPTCAGRNLADCPTDTCLQWKQEIQDQLQQGKTPQQVIDYFKARFGPGVLQEPPKEGAVLVLWVLPVVGLIALAVGAVILLRRLSTPPVRAGAETAQPVASVDAYTSRLEEEVRETQR